VTPSVTICCIDETQQGQEENFPVISHGGVRSMVIGSYEIPRIFYAHGLAPSIGCKSLSAVRVLSNVGVLLKYAHDLGYTVRLRKRRIEVDIEKLLTKWQEVIVGLAIAHDKDQADRYEAAIDDCLTPLLTAPIAQVREFASRFLAALKADPRVPFLVWRSYEVWVDEMVAKASDEEVRLLKTGLAAEIVALVEPDVRDQLPEAMIRALQWRSPEKLEEFKQVVVEEQRKGNKVRLRGRESCLFVEAGGTEEKPEVCVQI
jgi:hypothetical protein